MNWFKSMLLSGLLMTSVISQSSAVKCYDCVGGLHDGCDPFDTEKMSQLPQCNGTACSKKGKPGGCKHLEIPDAYKYIFI